MPIPLDRELVQESLKKVAEGPEALMKWAKEHADQIDQKFINQLHRMVEYSEKNRQPQLSKTFAFLEQCFSKMFAMDASPVAIAITKENFAEHFAKASDLLRQGKAKMALGLLQMLDLFLVQNPQGNAKTVITANLGIAYSLLEQYEPAMEHLQAALQAPDLPENAKEKVVSNLGILERGRGHVEQAIQYYHQALDLAQQRQDLAMAFTHLNNLALAYLEQKDLARCLQYQEQALQVAKQLKKPVWQQDCMARLAVIYGMQGNTKRCQELCHEGLNINIPKPKSQK